MYELIIVILVILLIALAIYHFSSRIGPSPTEPFQSPPCNQRGDYIHEESGLLMDGPSFDHEKIIGVSANTRASIPADYYWLDDGAGSTLGLHHNLCSKSCCSDQWPVPFKLKDDPLVCNNKHMFVKSPYMCNNPYQDSGCLCLTTTQAENLYSRGANAYLPSFDKGLPLPRAADSMSQKNAQV